MGPCELGVRGTGQVEGARREQGGSRGTGEEEASYVNLESPENYKYVLYLHRLVCMYNKEAIRK